MIRALFRSKGVRQAFALGSGTALGQLAVLVASPIWSRIYDPTDFGRYGLIVSFLSTATAAISLRYDAAIPLARDQEEALRLVLLALFCAVPVSILSGALFLVLALRNMLGFGVVAPWAAVFVVVSLALTSVFSILRYWHVRNSNFRDISGSLVAQGLGRALTPILLSPLRLSWFGLLSGELIGRSLGIRKLAKGLPPLLMDAARLTTPSKLKELLRAYRQYPLVFLPSSILDAASAAIAVPVVVSLYGVSTGGEFLLAQQVVSAPAALICGSLGDVFHAQLVPGANRQAADLPKLVWRTAFRLLILACVIYVPVASLAPSLAVPIFGFSWSRVGQFVAILSPATIIMVAVNPVTRAMLVSRIPHIKLFADLVKLVLPVVGLVLGFKLTDGSVTKSLTIYSGMLVLSYLIYFATVLTSIRANNQLPAMR